MQLTAPVSAPEDIGPLKAAGAREIYCGYLPPEWRTAYGGHDSISRRQGMANLQNKAQLRQTAELCTALRLPSWLALNGRYSPDQYAVLLSIARDWQAFGGKGLILRDIGFLYRLREEKLCLSIAASLLTVCVNADGVRFLKSLGVSRIVLPRFLTLEEMKRIAAEEPDPEYECMVMADHCPMIDGFCRGLHAERGADCPPLCGQIPRKSAEPCAACRMRELERAGIRFGKIGGRGTPIESRCKQTAFCAFAAESGDSRLLRQVYRQSFGHDCDCYYPE